MVKRPAQRPVQELVEFTDDHDRPLGVMPLPDVHRQSLRHRSVLVLVYNLKNKLYLQKRSEVKSLYPSRFDLSAAGHVRSGEARLDAAARELRQELGLVADRLRLVSAVPASRETGFEFVTLYSAGKFAAEPKPNPKEVSDGMFVDHAELAYMVGKFRELLTPGLVLFFEKRVLFPLDI